MNTKYLKGDIVLCANGEQLEIDHVSFNGYGVVYESGELTFGRDFVKELIQKEPFIINGKAYKLFANGKYTFEQLGGLVNKYSEPIETEVAEKLFKLAKRMGADFVINEQGKIFTFAGSTNNYRLMGINGLNPSAHTRIEKMIPFS